MHCTASGTDARRRGEPGPRPSPPTPAAAGSSGASAWTRDGSQNTPRRPRQLRTRAANTDARRRGAFGLRPSPPTPAAERAAESATHEDTIRAPRDRDRVTPSPPPQPLTRLSKNRKKRGSVSAGHGRIGKHRKHPGGRGNAGGQHHMRTLFDQFHPGYFGKVGMRQFHRTKARYHCPMINVEMLWSTLPEGTVAPAGQAPVVDVTQHGFFKVGGKGLVAKPMVVKAKLFTAVAEKKIKAAGGACILV